jgi:hypothetical protein
LQRTSQQSQRSRQTPPLQSLRRRRRRRRALFLPSGSATRQVCRVAVSTRSRPRANSIVSSSSRRLLTTLEPCPDDLVAFVSPQMRWGRRHRSPKPSACSRFEIKGTGTTPAMPRQPARPWEEPVLSPSDEDEMPASDDWGSQKRNDGVHECCQDECPFATRALTAARRSASTTG